MKFSQLFTLFQPFLLVSARFNDPDNSRIIGGKETTAGRFPFTVSLSDDIGHFCGGSLIAPDVVLVGDHSVVLFGNISDSLFNLFLLSTLIT
jgi:secreted trypsin-like serine protease